MQAADTPKHYPNSKAGRCAYCTAWISPGKGIVAHYSRHRGWAMFCTLRGCYSYSRGRTDTAEKLKLYGKKSFASRSKKDILHDPI